MASDGITKLIKVTQQKSTNANEEALEGAANQRSNIDKQKSLRDVQKTLDSFTQDSSMSRADTKATAKPGANLNSGAIASEASVSKPASYLTRFSKSGFEKSSLFSAAGLAKNLVDVRSSPTHYASGLNAFVKALRERFEESTKDLEGKDKLGNFSIQNLLSVFNEAETLAA